MIGTTIIVTLGDDVSAETASWLRGMMKPYEVGRQYAICFPCWLHALGVKPPVAEKTDCKHYQEYSDIEIKPDCRWFFVYDPDRRCFIGPGMAGCDRDASWCKYEPRDKPPDDVHKRLTVLEHKLLNHRHVTGAGMGGPIVCSTPRWDDEED